MRVSGRLPVAPAYSNYYSDNEELSVSEGSLHFAEVVGFMEEAHKRPNLRL
jgi:hypothetical protein